MAKASMLLWDIYQWTGRKGGLGIKLGQVRAAHHPAALKAAWRKWDIRANEHQRRIIARLVPTEPDDKGGGGS